jgi:hypothetical protein
MTINVTLLLRDCAQASNYSTRWLGERDQAPLMRELSALVYAHGDERQQTRVRCGLMLCRGVC